MTYENITQVTDMHSDSWFCYASYDFVSRHIPNVKQNNTYQYLYTYQAEHSLFPVEEPPFGVAHADELFLQFYPFADQKYNLNAEDQKMSDILISLWKNFIKFGNPSTQSISWNPIVDLNDRKYLYLNNTPVMKDSLKLKERMEFWDLLMNGKFDRI